MLELYTFILEDHLRVAPHHQNMEFHACYELYLIVFY